MTDPTIAAKQPVVIELEPGTYFWCTCGLSIKQPFCDGAHKGGEFKPYKIVLEKKTKLALCQCKHTGSAPHCDGSHGRI